MVLARTWPLALLALAGCRAIADIPDPELASDAASGPSDARAAEPDGDPVEPEALCDYADDDGDGLVDEGYTYVEDTNRRRTLDTGPYPAVWWLARSADRVAVVWVTGDGTAGDTISVRVFDLDGAPVTPRLTTQVGQPWKLARPYWVGPHLMIAATRRTYACEDGPVNCPTYLWAIDEDGAEVLAPTWISTGTPSVVGAWADGDEYAAGFVPATGQGDVEVRSFDDDAQPGAVDATAFATARGESITWVHAIRRDDDVHWLYSSSQTGFTLRVTDPAGTMTQGATSLDLASVGVAQIGFDTAVLTDEGLIVAYAIGEETAVGAWTTSGAPLRAPAPLDGMAWPAAMSDGFGQIYVLAGRREDDVPRDYLWRVSLDGRIAQAGAAVEIPENHTYAALAGVPEGVLVVVADYGAGDRPVTFTRFGCP